MVISVVICTYNRCESLKDTLDTLLVQDCNGSFNYEVIVVDNNSKDKTKGVVTSYMPKFNGHLRYIFESNQGLSYARNRGVKEAKGKIIAFTDDDVVVDRAWIMNIWKCFRDYACDGMGGRVLPLYPKNTPKWVKDNRDLLCGPFVSRDYGRKVIIYSHITMKPIVGANMAFKRECFDFNGLFRTDLGPGKGTMGDDTEFVSRLENANLPLHYNGNALVWHKVDRKRMNLRYIAKWSIACGRFWALKDERNLERGLICYFGVPRYLIKEIATDAVSLISKLLNKRALLKKYTTLFLKIGMILEYKRIHKWSK